MWSRPGLVHIIFLQNKRDYNRVISYKCFKQLTRIFPIKKFWRAELIPQPPICYPHIRICIVGDYCRTISVGVELLIGG